MDFADALTLRGLERLSDDEFFHFCRQNRDLRIERSAGGEIIIMSPTGTRSGERSGEVFGQLYVWNRQSRAGHVFDSSTGFTLPDGSVLSPDASWISHERWDALPQEERERFAPVCPELVVEVVSPSDSLPALQAKVEIWVANGCRLGLLIDPEREVVFLYRAGGRREERRGFDHPVSGENVLPGFELELSALR